MKNPLMILTQDKKFSVPGKEIHWTLNRSKLSLRAVVVSGSSTTFNPGDDLRKLGSFESWRVTPGESDALELTCTWDARMIQDAMFQTLNNALMQHCKDT